MSDERAEIIALCCAFTFFVAFLAAVPLFFFGHDGLGTAMLLCCVITLCAVCLIKEPYDD